MCVGDLLFRSAKEDANEVKRSLVCALSASFLALSQKRGLLFVTLKSVGVLRR